MRRTLQWTAALAALAAVALWLARGAHRGWTQTQVPVKTLDEITGIEGITYRRHWVPGLDFLAVAGLGAGVLWGASLVCRRQVPVNSQPTN